MARRVFHLRIGEKLIGDASWEQISFRQRKQASECYMCDKTAVENGRELDVHHLVPLMAGGDNGDWNLTVLCRSCHQKAESYTRAIPEINPVLTE